MVRTVTRASSVVIVCALSATASAYASPIGYSGQVSFVSAGGGVVNQIVVPIGTVTDAVPSFNIDFEIHDNFATPDGSIDLSGRIRGSGGSIGAAAGLFAFDDPDAPTAGFQRNVVGNVTASISYRDSFTITSDTLAPGTMAPFAVRATSSIGSSPTGTGCDSASGGSTLIYEDFSSITFNYRRSLSIGSQSLGLPCYAPRDFEVMLPIGTTFQVAMSYFLVAQVVSWNVLGEDSLTGVGLTFNDLNSFDLYFAPVGSGYGFTAASGNSFAFPTSDPVPVPEPSALSITALGILALGRRVLRRRKSHS